MRSWDSARLSKEVGRGSDSQGRMDLEESMRIGGLGLIWGKGLPASIVVDQQVC